MPRLKSPNYYKQVINVAKRQLNLDEQTYRDNLKSVVNKDSLRDMSAIELFQILEHLKKLGFRFVPREKLSPKTNRRSTPLDKLRQIWIEMYKQGFLKDGSEQALESWALKQAKALNKGVAIEKLVWLKLDMVDLLIEQLKQWHKRLLRTELPKAYQRVLCLADKGTLTNEQKAAVMGWQVRISKSPETHEVLSNSHRYFLELLGKMEARKV